MSQFLTVLSVICQSITIKKKTDVLLNKLLKIKN